MRDHRRRQAVAAVLLVSVLVASCAAGGVEGAAGRRGAELGLSAPERAAFTGEVEACVDGEPAGRQGVAPSTTVAVGVSGETSGASAGGLAAVGVVASAVVAGIGYRAYRWWKWRPRAATRTRVERNPSAAPDASAAPRADGSAEPDAAARTANVTSPTLETCLDIVTARWRQRVS